MSKFLVINGPNMNNLGKRDQSLYGAKDLATLTAELERRGKELGAEVECFQANSEGEIVNHIQSAAPGAAGIVINPAALTAAGYSLLDALLDTRLPFVEVHLSNIHAREEFRRNSIFARYAAAQVSGLGDRGYHHALEHLAGLK